MNAIARDDVVWAYRLLLGREPESESVIQSWMREAESRHALARHITASDEYKGRNGPVEQSPFWHYISSFDAAELIKRYANDAISPSPDHVTNFLGVRIRPKFFPEILAGLEGTVQSIPIPANWHADMAEWASCFRALDMSRGRFVMVELGCGWGCWMNNLGVTAKRVGKRIKLYGVEADAEHCNYARLALSDNGIDEREFVVQQGIAGKSASTVLFPKIESGINWGGSAIFDPSPKELKEAISSKNYVPIAVVDIEKLTRDESMIDLLHVDIQGAELGLLTEIFELLCKKMRFVFVGTHSKQIEGGLFDLFMRKDIWKMEMERPAIFRLVDGRPIVIGDGVQLWRNCSLD